MSEAQDLEEKIKTSRASRAGGAMRSPLAGNSAPIGFDLRRRGRDVDLDVVLESAKDTLSGQVRVGKTNETAVATEYALPVEVQEGDRAGLDFENLNKKITRGIKLEAPGRIKGFRRLMDRWGFTRKDAKEILGFDNEGMIGELYTGIEKVQQRDVKDRLRLFLSLAVDLHGLFREHDVIKEWFDEPHGMLRGKTPRSLLVEGSMENLLRVKQLAQYEANR
jgi:hypothetical protein